MSVVLFVGGPLDGQVKECEYRRLAVAPQADQRYRDPRGPIAEPPRVAYYVLRPYILADLRLMTMLPEEWPVETASKAELGTYRQRIVAALAKAAGLAAEVVPDLGVQCAFCGKPWDQAHLLAGGPCPSVGAGR